MQRAEILANSAIRDGIKVTVTVYKEDTPEEELKEVQTEFQYSCFHLFIYL